MRSCDGGPGREDELLPVLRRYRVPYPDEREVNRTVDALRMYVPAGRGRARAARMKKLLYDAAVCVHFTDVWFWTVSALLYAAGFALALGASADAYRTVLIIAPLPFVFSLLQVFRGREEGVLELELSCRVTPQELAVSRILIACAYNAALNVCLSLALFLTEPAVLLGKITLFWLLPMLLTGGAALWLCARVRSGFAVPVTLSVWLTSAALLTVLQRAAESFFGLHGWAWAVLLAAGAAFFAREVFRMKKGRWFAREAAEWN